MKKNSLVIISAVMLLSINLILESPSYGEQGSINLDTFKWQLEDSGVRIVSVSSSVTKPGLMCNIASSMPHAMCGVGVAIESKGLTNGVALNYGPTSSYTADQAVSATNSTAGKFWGPSAFQEGSDITGACLFTFIANSEADVKNQNFSLNWMGSICKGGVIPPIPIPATCKFSGSILIDYGDLTSGALPGAKKTGTAIITCDQDTAIVLKVYDKKTNTNSVLLREDNSLTATLTVDDVDTSSEGKNIDVKANIPTPVMIDSELKTSGTPEAGGFTGSAIATISIP